nr:NADH dehydrogenase subunit 6 [Dimorphopteryx sp. 1 GYN-2021]
MMIFFLFLILLNSLLFWSMKTPLLMGLILMIQTLLISLASGMMSFYCWYSYILFLIMIGGMLILFIYISSLSSDQKFNFNKNFNLKILILLMIFFFTSLNFKYNLSLNIDSMAFLNNEMEQNFILKMSMNKLYNFPTNKITLILINYLLITMFIVVKITNIKMGPLRKNF